jgi:glutamate-1-semialdehyde aminotransferase
LPGENSGIINGLNSGVEATMKMEHTNSEKLWKKGKKLVINGTSLFSRGPRINVDGVAPKYYSKARGCYFWDVDGHKFLDYGMAVGSIILGWGYIDYAIRKQLKNGNNPTILSPLQVELGEKIHKNIPSCGRMKFLSTGSEATETAVRIARAYTGRDVVIHDHYHGWISWCAPLKGGIPKCYSDLSIKEESSDIEQYKKLLDENEVACVILEPTKAEDESKKEQRSKFLSELKKECHKHDTLLVFDEVACGYRFGVGGAQKFFDVIPDVSAFGKSISNGYPFSFVCSLEEIANDVEGKIFVSSTFGGNTIGFTACLETTKIMEEKNVASYLAKYGKELKNSINTISKEHELQDIIRVTGYSYRLMWKQTDWDLISLLFQEFIKQKIFFGWEIKNSLSHDIDTDMKNTINAFTRAIKICKKAHLEGKVIKYLQGKPMRPIL